MEEQDQTDFLRSVSLKRRSTGEQVADSLREAILDGRLAAGAPLREATLAEAFNVSRNTIRVAIQALDRDGLVTHRAHRGAVVTELEPEGIKDVYATRRLIELSALETIPSANSLRPLEAALADLQAAADSGDDDALRDADLEFHRAIAGLRRSPRLSALFDEMEAETRLSMLRVGNVQAAPDQIYREHEQILENLKAGEVEQARDLLDAHLRESESLLLEAFAQRRAEAAEARP